MDIYSNHGIATIDPYLFPGGSSNRGQVSTIVSGGITGYTHQSVPHYPRVSLHYTHIFLFLSLPFLHHYLFICSGARVSEELGVIITGVVSILLRSICALRHEAAIISRMICLPSPGQCQTGEYPRHVLAWVCISRPMQRSSVSGSVLFSVLILG